MYIITYEVLERVNKGGLRLQQVLDRHVSGPKDPIRDEADVSNIDGGEPAVAGERHEQFVGHTKHRYALT